MPLTIAAVAVFGTQVMGLSLGAAIVLAAVLAPTDPVLAGDVGVGPPGEEDESEPSFSITGEAGLNDGLAFPFVLLGIILAGQEPAGWFGDWLLQDVLYKVARRRRDRQRARLRDRGRGRAPARPRPALGRPRRMARHRRRAGHLRRHGGGGAYGFLAAFAGGVAFRRYEHGHEYNRSVHNGAETVEKFGELALILLLGSSVTLAGLQAPGWTGWLLAPALLLAIRPASVAAALGAHAHTGPGARVRGLVRRARDRIALLRGRRRGCRRPERERDHDDRMDDDRVRDRLDRRPRDDGERAQPPLVGNGPLKAPATFSVRGIGVGARG